jgi:hypothetical protein
VHIAWEYVIVVWNCVLKYKRIILHRLSGSGRGQLQTKHCEFPHSRHELKKMCRQIHYFSKNKNVSYLACIKTRGLANMKTGEYLKVPGENLS